MCAALDYRICDEQPDAYKLSRHAKTVQNLWFLKSQLGLLKGIRHDNGALDGKYAARRLEIEEYVPCTANYAKQYMKRADVKAALHVNPSVTWSQCSDYVDYNSTDSRIVSTVPIYNFLIDGGYNLKILVFSGDDDSVCGTIGTQSWIWDLGYEVSDEVMWKEYFVEGQVAGFRSEWPDAGLMFLTIHAAGHEVCCMQCMYRVYYK